MIDYKQAYLQQKLEAAKYLRKIGELQVLLTEMELEKLQKEIEDGPGQISEDSE